MTEKILDGTTDVIVVSYNSSEDIIHCLQPLLGCEDIRVHVVDNASTDMTTKILRSMMREHSNLSLHALDHNLGFAAGVNQVLGGHVGDVLLLNPDARIEATAVRQLREHASRIGVGIVSPILENGATVRVMSAGEFPRIWPMITHFTGLSRLFPETSWLKGRHLFLGSHDAEDRDVEWVSGGCLYISGEALAVLGPLTEKWFMYGEDLEYCHRALSHGFAVQVAAGVRATHALGSSVNETVGNIALMWPRHTFEFYKETFSPGLVRRFTWKLVFSGGLASRALVWKLMALRQDNGSALNSRARRFLAFAIAVWTKSFDDEIDFGDSHD